MHSGESWVIRDEVPVSASWTIASPTAGPSLYGVAAHWKYKEDVAADAEVRDGRRPRSYDGNDAGALLCIAVLLVVVGMGDGVGLGCLAVAQAHPAAGTPAGKVGTASGRRSGS
jgi:hypothetical protein